MAQTVDVCALQLAVAREEKNETMIRHAPLQDKNSRILTASTLYRTSGARNSLLLLLLLSPSHPRSSTKIPSPRPPYDEFVEDFLPAIQRTHEDFSSKYYRPASTHFACEASIGSYGFSHSETLSKVINYTSSPSLPDTAPFSCAKNCPRRHDCDEIRFSTVTLPLQTIFKELM